MEQSPNRQTELNILINISEDINSYVETLKNSFITRKEFAPDELKYFENRIEGIRSQRFDEIPPRIVVFDNDIPLREYYNIAWDCGENGLGQDVPTKIYLLSHVVLGKILIKYPYFDPTESYYKRLNKTAKEEYILGAASLWFYYWLKQELAEFKKSLDPGSIQDYNNNASTKLAYLMQLYYEKGCNPLTKPQVIQLAKEKGITLLTLVNRWKILQDDNYSHCSNPNKMKQFAIIYKSLMEIFESSNQAAFKEVQAAYNLLINTHPNLVM
jgi:hypothetical protein